MLHDLSLLRGAHGGCPKISPLALILRRGIGVGIKGVAGSDTILGGRFGFFFSRGGGRESLRRGGGGVSAFY